MIFSMRLEWRVLALAWACGSALLAAELEGPQTYHYGIRLSAATPRHDFRDLTTRTGFGGGLFAEAEYSPSTVVQTRLDYLSYPQYNRPNASGIPAWTAPNPITLAANSTALGLEIRHAFAGFQRFSLSGGLMAIRYELDTSGAGTLIDQNGLPVTGITRVQRNTPLKLGLAVGVGFELLRGLTLAERFTTADIEGTSFATLETSLSYRF